MASSRRKKAFEDAESVQMKGKRGGEMMIRKQGKEDKRRERVSEKGKAVMEPSGEGWIDGGWWMVEGQDRLD